MTPRSRRGASWPLPTFLAVAAAAAGQLCVWQCARTEKEAARTRNRRRAIPTHGLVCPCPLVCHCYEGPQVMVSPLVRPVRATPWMDFGLLLLLYPPPPPRRTLALVCCTGTAVGSSSGRQRQGHQPRSIADKLNEGSRRVWSVQVQAWNGRPRMSTPTCKLCVARTPTLPTLGSHYSSSAGSTPSSCQMSSN